jgi:phospholipid transport system substrate-binding protein
MPKLSILFFALAVGVSTAATAAPTAATPAAPSSPQAPTALQALQRHHASLTSMVKAGAKAATLQAAVDPMIDYRWLAQATLGGSSRAPGVCETRCAEFEALLTRLVRRNYLRLIEDAADRPVVFEGQVAGRNQVFKVTTKVSTVKNGRVQSMTIAYVMHGADDTFTVRDIITDGVSLVRTYRYEFKTMAERGGIAQVITNLQSKLKQ